MSTPDSKGRVKEHSSTTNNQSTSPSALEMAATPWISFLGPTDLDGYDRKLPPSKQPSNIPKTFLDAMEVREEVFVKEQGVPMENEFDSDDHRACHWVIYASICTVVQEEAKDMEGNIVKPKRSESKALPIGTIRVVPFPHPPHPIPGSSYAADEDGSRPSSPTSPTGDPLYLIDRATTYHDGKEPYIKLGRLAVLKEFRGFGSSNLLVNGALAWLKNNPRHFNPSILKMGLERLGGDRQFSMWQGLVCVHAQKQVAKAWAKWGFSIDEGMGTWIEEGIDHVGMFRRLDLADELRRPSLGDSDLLRQSGL